MQRESRARGRRRRSQRQEEEEEEVMCPVILGAICFNCWVWVAGRRADVFGHTHVCIVSPCFVIVIDTLLFRLALGAEKKRKKLFTTMLLVHFFPLDYMGGKKQGAYFLASGNKFRHKQNHADENDETLTKINASKSNNK